MTAADAKVKAVQWLAWIDRDGERAALTVGAADAGYRVQISTLYGRKQVHWIHLGTLAEARALAERLRALWYCRSQHLFALNLER
jgi:hypothetical protein